MKPAALVGILLLALLARGWQIPQPRVLEATPATYRDLLPTLKPGDSLVLSPGTYPRLRIVNLQGEPEAWITIAGPLAGPPAIIAGEPEHDTVDIVDSSYVSIENLRIDSRGIPGAFGVSTKGKEQNLTHHIRVQNNVFVGQNGSQQTDAISTKNPTYGWIVRYNQIIGAGTGMYFGNSDGTQPFLDGIIENNLIRDTIGYNMEIKHQNSLPDIPGLPTGPTTTIVRHNVFIKNDQISPDGDRPNVLFGSSPQAGDGAMNMYEIYGNYFIHNHREALLQAAGRVSIHDNVFVDGPYDYPAVVLRTQDKLPLKIGYFYHNTIFTTSKGVYYGTRAMIDDAVVGNLIFATLPISGQIMRQESNIVDNMVNASKYVASATFEIDKMDFYPLAGRCQGAPVDLSIFEGNEDYTRDFNGASKVGSKGQVAFRGAYAGEGTNPGWQPREGMMPPLPPSPRRMPTLVWLAPPTGRSGSTVTLELSGASFTSGDTVEISGAGVAVNGIEVSTASHIKAVAKIAAGLPASTRDVVVVSPSGKSNPMKFRIASAPARRQ